jgi:transcriptional regulator with GAF, ATPase, and Fis domain
MTRINWPVVPGHEALACSPVLADSGLSSSPQNRALLNQAALVHLTADIAARFVTVDPDIVDDTIVDSLRRIAGVLQLDRVVLWQMAGEHSDLAPSHVWAQQPAPEAHAVPTEISYFASKLASGEAGWFARAADLSSPADRELCERHGVVSAAVVPVTATNPLARRGALLLCSTMGTIAWTPEAADQLRVAAAVFAQALERKASSATLKAALNELQELREHMSENEAAPSNVHELRAVRLRDQLQAENVYLRRENQDRLGPNLIVGQSPAIRRVLEQARQVAATDSTVLLLGETGTGKELIATQIHELSARRSHVMVRVNCSAIPGTLMESELFGREKGAFTGALARQVGRFELADGSTIFLDEIGDLPADVQVKLLRVLEERHIERLGSPKSIRVNVRIIAATHRNLEKRIADDAFREDLFYRLNVFPIQVPALRERVEDIPLLVWRFVDEFSKAFGKRVDAIPRENMLALQQYTWPGNIRELRNVVERAMIVCTGPQLTIALPASSNVSSPKRSVRMVDVEKDHIRSVLESAAWRIRGTAGAAERLGLRPTTLETRMAKLGITRPRRLA